MRRLSNESLFPGIGLFQESDTMDGLGVVSNNILTNLNEAMADELLAMYQYFTQVRVLEDSNVKQYIIKELKQHAMEEYKHAGWIADRIVALGGQVITNPSELYTHSGCGITEPTDPNSLQIVTDAINGERCAIQSYTSMADFAMSTGDVQTYDMFQYIIKDEIEHESDLNKLIIDYRLR